MGLLLLVLVNLSLAGASSSGGKRERMEYGEALSKSLLYFEAQRSGRLPYDHRLSWRHHSALTDGLDQGVDLVGGYYDAGDNVKFGLPMAFTITMLAWSVSEYSTDMASADQLHHALTSIKWGTDYFLKAHSEPNILWAQVGDANADHYCWQRPEDMTTSRRAYKIDPDHPGSDVAGETAAAMAAAAIVFRQHDPRYAHLLFLHAQQLFRFADRYRGRYHHSVPASKSYYASISGYGDELLWAALWLHKAAMAFDGNGSYYLDYVIRNGHELGGTGWAMTEFSWDVKYAGVQLLVAKLFVERGEKEGEKGEERRLILTKYRAKAEHYLCACLGKNENGSNVRRTPGGLLFMRPWNNMQYVSNAAFLLAVYGDSLNRSGEELRCPTGAASASELISAAKALADYILGRNPMSLSYLVGFGPKYPKKVHHRGASVVSFKQSEAFVGCTQGYDDWYARAEENPNVLVGALVGGPDENDEFRDERWNYMQTEACTYNTAPLVGVFARMLRKGN